MWTQLHTHIARCGVEDTSSVVCVLHTDLMVIFSHTLIDTVILKGALLFETNIFKFLLIACLIFFSYFSQSLLVEWLSFGVDFYPIVSPGLWQNCSFSFTFVSDWNLPSLTCHSVIETTANAIWHIGSIHVFFHLLGLHDSGWLPDVLNVCGITAVYLEGQKS